MAGVSEGGFIGTNFALHAPERTITWAFGNDPDVTGMFSERSPLLMIETFPRKERPVQFGGDQLRCLKVPVLLVLGSRDNLVGDPERSRESPERTVVIQPSRFSLRPACNKGILYWVGAGRKPWKK